MEKCVQNILHLLSVKLAKTMKKTFFVLLLLLFFVLRFRLFCKMLENRSKTDPKIDEKSGKIRSPKGVKIMSQKMLQTMLKKWAQGFQKGSQHLSKILPKRGNKGGKKNYILEVAPRASQELQNEPKLVPKVTKLRSKGSKMEPKIHQNLRSHLSAFTCFDYFANFSACVIFLQIGTSEAKRSEALLS